MKNILIPTIFESDTEHALRVAADLKHNSSGDVILFSVSEVSDSITDLLFLSSQSTVDIRKQDQLLEFWKQFKARNSSAAEVKVHHQYGLSRPLCKRLISRFEVDMVIVPLSFRMSKQYIHQFAMRLFHQSGCPMMLLPDNDISYKGIQRALYLDELKEVASQPVQQYAFHVIHKSMMPNNESIQTIVNRMQIDLIVKQKRKVGENDIEMSDLGLPILTI